MKLSIVLFVTALIANSDALKPRTPHLMRNRPSRTPNLVNHRDIYNDDDALDPDLTYFKRDIQAGDEEVDPTDLFIRRDLYKDGTPVNPDTAYFKRDAEKASSNSWNPSEPLASRRSVQNNAQTHEDVNVSNYTPDIIESHETESHDIHESQEHESHPNHEEHEAFESLYEKSPSNGDGDDDDK